MYRFCETVQRQSWKHAYFLILSQCFQRYHCEPAGRSSIGYTWFLFCTMVQISFITYPSKINGGLHKITQNANHRAPPSWMPETSIDVVKYCKNNFKRLKKKVSSASTDDLQHQKLKVYLHFTKKNLEVIRINFVEIPWLVSLLKTRVFTFPDAHSIASRDDLQLTRDWTSPAFHRERPGSRYELSRNTFWHKFME